MKDSNKILVKIGVCVCVAKFLLILSTRLAACCVILLQNILLTYHTAASTHLLLEGL